MSGATSPPVLQPTARQATAQAASQVISGAAHCTADRRAAADGGSELGDVNVVSWLGAARAGHPAARGELFDRSIAAGQQPLPVGQGQAVELAQLQVGDVAPAWQTQ